MPLSRVKLIQCDTAVSPDQGTTSGSQSTPTNFNEANLAQACATAREALLQLAAERLGVPVDQLTVVDGVVGVQGDASRWVGYGELVGGQEIQPDAQRQREAEAREPSGRCSASRLAASTCRRWRPARSSSSTTCACPACCTAAWSGRRPSARRWSASTRARFATMPGVVKVVVKKNFVGVVAEKPWQAIQAAREAEGDVDAGRRPAQPRRVLRLTCATQKPSRDTLLVNSKDVDERLAQAADGGQGDLSASVPDARVDGQLVRGRRRAGRQGDDLVADPVGLSDAERLGAAARPADRRTCA